MKETGERSEQSFAPRVDDPRLEREALSGGCKVIAGLGLRDLVAELWELGIPGTGNIDPETYNDAFQLPKRL